MEKIFWQGTFAEAEVRDDLYWAAQSEQQRLASLLEIREMYFEDFDAPIQVVGFRRNLRDEEG